MAVVQVQVWVIQLLDILARAFLLLVLVVDSVHQIKLEQQCE